MNFEPDDQMTFEEYLERRRELRERIQRLLQRIEEHELQRKDCEELSAAALYSRPRFDRRVRQCLAVTQSLRQGNLSGPPFLLSLASRSIRFSSVAQ